MALTPEQLQAAIQRYQGGASMTSAPPPVVAPSVQQPVIEQPAPAPVVAPPAAPPPAPVVEAPAPVVIAPTTNSRQAMAQMDQATAGQIDAGNEISAAQVQQAQDQAAVIEQQNAMEKQLQEQAQAREAERQAARDKIHSDYQELNQQASSIQEKDRRTTGQRVMGILALALGSVADGFARMGGNTNTDYSGQISSQIDAQIERDLEMQRRAIDDKRKAAASKLTELGLARQFGADEKEAEEHARIFRKEMYARELSATAARSQVPAIRANAEAAAAKLLGEAAEKKASLLTSKENAAFNAMAANARIQQTQNIQPGNTPLTQLEALEKEGRLTANQAQELESVRHAKRQNRDGSTGVIPNYESIDPTIELDAGSKAKAREIAAGVEGVSSAGQRLSELYGQIEQAEKAGKKDEADTLRSRYYSTGGAFLVQKSLAGGQGVINQADAERDAKEGAVPPPPGSGAAIIDRFSQQYRGVKPSADTIQQITKDISSDGIARLATYNQRPKAPQRWPGAQGDTPSAPAGKVRVVRADGVSGWLDADKAEAAIKSGKYKAAP